jgi:hypothetical protein
MRSGPFYCVTLASMLSIAPAAVAQDSAPTPDRSFIYREVGANQESDFDPDPDTRTDGIEQHRRFLVRLGFIAER